MTVHFGITLPDVWGDITTQACEIESLGYDYLAVEEHFMKGDPPTPTPLALPLLAVAAGATESLKLLTSVILTPFYHPTLLAKLAGTIDIASGGRLTLGVGIGGEYPAEFEANEVNIKERGSRTNEVLELLRLLWTEKDVKYLGKHFQLDHVTLLPRTVQTPHPPIWVGGRQEAAMKRAARFGDGWFPYFFNPERYTHSRNKILGFAEGFGKDMRNFQWGASIFISIQEDKPSAIKSAAEQMSNQFTDSGDFTRVAEKYVAAGTPDECAESILRYYKSGARYLIFNPVCESKEKQKHLEIIANEIIPIIRSEVKGS